MAIDVNQIAVVVRDAVAKITAPLASRIKALEARKCMAFRGAWSPGETYVAGDVTQRSKGLFVALADAGEDDKPGMSDKWRQVGSF